MTARSILKSPGFLGASGLAGGGATGVGGGQIYEAADPSLHSSLTGLGFIYSPISTPLEALPTESKFTQWNNWGCVEKLFPGIVVKHEQQSGSTLSVSDAATTTLDENLQAENNFMACAMMQLKTVTLHNNYQNQLYFKSEVVVKGENYGGMMGTGLSTLPEKDSDLQGAYKGAVNFLHKLVVLKKENESGNIKYGYAGFDYSSNQNQSDAKFVITTPVEKWFSKQNPGIVKDQSYEIPTKEGAGIAEISSNPKDKTLIESMSVYEAAAKPEFWGSDGTFPKKTKEDTTFGYSTAVLKYDVENSKGKMIVGTTSLDLSQYLKNVYDPFKDKKVVGNDLESWCNDGSRRRNRNVSANYKNDLQLLCYKNKPN